MELNGNGKKLNQSGIYKHKETGVEVELNATAEGTALIDAFVQVGFVYVGPKPEVVSQPIDEYTESATKMGAIQYRKNGKLISKDEYDNKLEKE